ncbi:MAG: MFS transporter [Ignavibacteria bacterium]|nr:MFS transporter [Ignavibacteria bacterium]
MPREKLYTRTFFLGFAYNFVLALHFTNNALYPLFVRQEGGGIAMVGLFMGVYSLAAVLGRPLIGLLIDRYGPREVLMLGALCLSLPALGYFLLLGTGMSPLVWVLRAVQGFGYGAHFSATFTLAALIAPSTRRNEAIAMYGVSGLAGAMIGPFIGEQLVEHAGLPVFFLAMCGVGLLAVAVVWNVRVGRAGTAIPRPSEVLRALVTRDMQLVAALAFLLALCYSTPQSFLAVIAKQRGIADFSLYFSAWGLGGTIIRFVGGSWGDKRGLRRVLMPSFAMYAAGLTLLAFSTGIAGVIVAGFLTGISHGLAFPAVASLGYALAPKAFTGSAMALVTGMMDTGAAVMALAVGPLAELVGYGIVFPIAAGAGASAVLLLVLSIRANPAPIRES